MVRFPVDAHVHLYPGTDIGRCLSGAATHMKPVWGAARAGVLMLTESAGRDIYATLPDVAGDWRISATMEDVSRIARRADGVWIVLISGRQVVSAEGLEVLALGTRDVLQDRKPLDTTLSAIRGAGALMALPWGVGKWAGARGKLVDALIDCEVAMRDIFLADSSVRPRIIPRPSRLARAEATGWRVLAGTDPLPFAGEEEKPGRFGFLAEGTPNPDRPFEALAIWLKALSRSPESYGTLETFPRFISQQTMMQLRKRFW